VTFICISVTYEGLKEMDAYHKSPFFNKLVETIRNIFGDDMNIICVDLNYDSMPTYTYIYVLYNITYIYQYMFLIYIRT